MLERLRRFIGLSTSNENQPKAKSTTTEQPKPVERSAARPTSFGGTPVNRRDNGGSDDGVLPTYMLLNAFNTPPGNDTAPSPAPAKTSFFGGGGPDVGGGGDTGGGGGGGDGGGEITCNPNRDPMLHKQYTLVM